MTSAPSLSVDLWHVVSLHVGSARALAAMVGVSKEWRAAVTNDSWCRVTCLRFPRVVAIVTALEMVTPVYREVYRDQLACTFPAAAVPPSSVDERLRNFVFTIEFFIGDTPFWSWTGPFQTKLEGADPIDRFLGCRLWTQHDRPPWAINYLISHFHRSTYAARITARILVTKRIGTCIRTRILTDMITDDWDNTGFLLKERNNSSTTFDSDGNAFTPMAYRTDVPGGTAALIVATAIPQVLVDQGIFEFVILTPDDELWSPEAAIDFLERFVAW